MSNVVKLWEKAQINANVNFSRRWLFGRFFTGENRERMVAENLRPAMLRAEQSQHVYAEMLVAFRSYFQHRLPSLS